MSSQRLGSIVHATPGRIRLRVARDRRTPADFAQIESLLKMLPGIQSIEVTPKTGSVLVRYDPTQVDVRSLLRMGAEIGVDTGWSAGSIGGRHGLAWPEIDRARLAKGVALLGVAGLGGIVGPAVGVGARLGSILASVAFVAAARGARHLGRQMRPMR